MVFDRRAVLTGSFNFSASADSRNAENGADQRRACNRSLRERVFSVYGAKEGRPHGTDLQQRQKLCRLTKRRYGSFVVLSNSFFGSAPTGEGVNHAIIPLFVSRVVPVITMAIACAAALVLYNTSCQIDLRSGSHLSSRPVCTLSRREISNRPLAMPAVTGSGTAADVMFTGASIRQNI